MAIIRSLAVGKARKSAGNLTYTTIDGRTIVREKPVFVRNPRTEGQVAQRSKMAKTVALWRWMGQSVKPFFTVRGRHLSEYNEFVKKNIGIADQFGDIQQSGMVMPSVGTWVASGEFPTGAISFRISDEEASAGYYTIHSQALLDKITSNTRIKFVGVQEDGSVVVQDAGNAREYDLDTATIGEENVLMVPAATELAAFVLADENGLWNTSAQLQETEVVVQP